MDARRGLFGLRTAEDLFRKLKREYKDLLEEPWNSRVAFNFFVTAWHMLEWLGMTSRKAREAFQEEHPVMYE